MITFRRIGVMLCFGLGLVQMSGDISASEPSIYSKILTPSPLGKDRVLVLCLLEESDKEILTQFYRSLNWSEFSERHLTIVEISKYAVQSVFLNYDGGVAGLINRVKHPDFGDKLRRKSDCNKDFEFVLIGKDTGVKKRWEKNLPQDALFQVIDAMPMRQYEMRQKERQN